MISSFSLADLAEPAAHAGNRPGPHPSRRRRQRAILRRCGRSDGPLHLHDDAERRQGYRSVSGLSRRSSSPSICRTRKSPRPGRSRRNSIRASVSMPLTRFAGRQAAVCVSGRHPDFRSGTFKQVDKIELAQPPYPGASPYRLAANDDPFDASGHGHFGIHRRWIRSCTKERSAWRPST